MNMKATVLAVGFASMMASGCLIVPAPPTGPVVLAPPLPPVVWMETEPYYVHGGYTYYYQNNGWYYSHQRSGPWVELPRDRYPHEVHYRHQEHGPSHGRRR